MEGKQTLRSLSFRNVLSFGDAGQELELGPLNVLIGPNGSGKSNVFEILNLLRSLPRDMTTALRSGGGIGEWLWKGSPETNIEIGSSWDYLAGSPPLLHHMTITPERFRSRIVEERIWQEGTIEDSLHYLFADATTDEPGGPLYFDARDRDSVAMATESFRLDVSILSQRRDPDRSPALAFLGDRYSELLLFRTWISGPQSTVRSLQRMDLPGNFLLEDYSNLLIVLHHMNIVNRKAWTLLIISFSRLYEGARDIIIKPVSGFLALFVVEDEGRHIPATRLSDGTLRYLCLLAILCHPNPPPFIGIEEPEIGLHPDVVPTIAKLLIAASERTQLLVTTHSASLISALGEVPESVVVCERGFEGTEFRRLDPERLRKWLDDYTLGDLWASGEIGGNRW